MGKIARGFRRYPACAIHQRTTQDRNNRVVKRIARALLDEISPEDNVPYYDEFVRDVGGVESMTGAMAYQSDLRNRLVTFIAEKYVPRETGRIICPACLTETPNNLSICIRCSGSLVSSGKEPPNRMEVYFLGYLNKRNQRVAMDPVTQKEILTWTKTRSIVW